MGKRRGGDNQKGYFAEVTRGCRFSFTCEEDLWGGGKGNHQVLCMVGLSPVRKSVGRRMGGKGRMAMMAWVRSKSEEGKQSGDTGVFFWEGAVGRKSKGKKGKKKITTKGQSAGGL